MPNYDAMNIDEYPLPERWKLVDESNTALAYTGKRDGTLKAQSVSGEIENKGTGTLTIYAGDNVYVVPPGESITLDDNELV